MANGHLLSGEDVEIYWRLPSSRKRHRMSSVQRTRLEVADIIEQFLNGTGDEWDWDDFCSYRITDLELDSVRLRCAGLSDIYPPQTRSIIAAMQGLRLCERWQPNFVVPNNSALATGIHLTG